MHQTHSKITSTKSIYPQINAAATHWSWRSALFVLGEEERTGVWVLGESDGGKKKGGDVYAGMVLRQWVRWVPQKVENFE